MIIENTNTKSGDYANVMTLPRPSHSDYPAYVKYDGNNDIRGGGHFSGRLTAPLVFAGAVAKQILKEKELPSALILQKLKTCATINLIKIISLLNFWKIFRHAAFQQ